MGAVAKIRPDVQPEFKDGEPPDDPRGTPICCPECEGVEFLFFEFRGVNDCYCANPKCRTALDLRDLAGVTEPDDLGGGNA